MKYIMVGHWLEYYIRKMCIQNEFYTRGTAQQYMDLMNYMRTYEPTTEAIEHVAKDIINHSSVVDDYPIEVMMCHVVNDCVKFCFIRQ